MNISLGFTLSPKLFSPSVWEWGMACTLWERVLWLLVFSLSVYAAAAIAGANAKTRWQHRADRWITGICLIGSALFLFLFAGFTARFWVAEILLFVYTYASVGDAVTHEVDHTVHVMILIAGFIGCAASDLPQKILGAAILFVPSLLLALIGANLLGGADIKFLGASGFCLGPYVGVLGTLIGCLIAIVVDLILSVIQKKNTSQKEQQKRIIPFVPYLSAGLLLAYILI